MAGPTLMINEVFHSIQGESTWAGLPCIFVRLTGCHLRCGYCDTAYAFHEGRRMTLDEVLDQVKRIGGRCRLVEVTGGEPLLQPMTGELLTRLCDANYTVLLETSGACDISAVDRRVHRIMDIKTPGSGETERNHWPNIEQLRHHDEVKFILTDRADYDWSRQVIIEHGLAERVQAVLLSAAAPVAGNQDIAGSAGLTLRRLAEWMLADDLPPGVRLQTQLHKLIWEPDTRGV